jgi:hypothetical protein
VPECMYVPYIYLLHIKYVFCPSKQFISQIIIIITITLAFYVLIASPTIGDLSII